MQFWLTAVGRQLSAEAAYEKRRRFELVTFASCGTFPPSPAVAMSGFRSIVFRYLPSTSAMGKRKAKSTVLSPQLSLDLMARDRARGKVVPVVESTSQVDGRVVAFPRKTLLVRDLDSAFQRLVELSHKLSW